MSVKRNSTRVELRSRMMLGRMKNMSRILQLVVVLAATSLFAEEPAENFNFRRKRQVSQTFQKEKESDRWRRDPWKGKGHGGWDGHHFKPLPDEREAFDAAIDAGFTIWFGDDGRVIDVGCASRRMRRLS